MRVAAAGSSSAAASSHAPVATIDTDPGTLAALLWHGHPLDEALAAGTLRIEGCEREVVRFLRLFPAARDAAAQAARGNKLGSAMTYTTSRDGRRSRAISASPIAQIAVSLAALGAAYEQLDEHTADVLEEQLFRPAQLAYGRAKRTHREFAARSGLPGRSFDTSTAGPQPQIGADADRPRRVRRREADQTIAGLQDSMLPVEVGDPELRAGLS